MGNNSEPSFEFIHDRICEQIRRFNKAYWKEMESNNTDTPYIYQIGAINALMHIAKDLNEIIEEETRSAYRYVFGSEQHKGFVNALKRIRDNIINRLQLLDNNICTFIAHRINNEEK